MPVNQRNILVILSFLMWVAVGFSAPPRELTHFSIFFERNGKNVQHTFKYDDVKSNLAFKARSPHAMLNPEKKIDDWEGVSFRSLFTKVGQTNFKTALPVTVIGSDGYLAQMEMHDFFDPDAMLATHCNGKKISSSMGGPQSFFPNLNPKLPKYLVFEGFGVWYTTAIIIGDLLPQITVERSHSPTLEISLRNVKGAHDRNEDLYFPPGHYRTPFGHAPVKVTGVNFLTWAKNLSDKPFQKLKVKTYYGDEVVLTKHLEEYEMNYAWNDKNIPAKFGGPIQLCPRGKLSSCLFFVQAVALEN